MLSSIINHKDPKIVVIYHENCTDGFASAWACHRYFNRARPGLEPRVEYIPVNYGTELYQSDLSDLLQGKFVFIVDFSFPRDKLLEYNKVAEDMVVLDHHKTSQKDCEGLTFCKFDMTKSGAMLAWEYFNDPNPSFKGRGVPRFIEYVQDYDLWKFEWPHSQAINAWIQSFELAFDKYDYMFGVLESPYPQELEKIVEQGMAIIRAENRAIEKAVIRANRLIIDGHEVKAVNNPHLISKTAGALAKTKGAGSGIGVAYFFNQEYNIVVSLRSDKDNPSAVDVSEVAKKFGGGGHKNAAGFTVSIDKFKEFIPKPN